MLNKVLTALLLISIYGLLVLFRFDTPPTLDVLVRDIEGQSTYTAGYEPSRGEIVATSQEWLSITFGDVQVFLDSNTSIKLEGLAEDGPTIRLLRGRLQATADRTPIWITTNTSENTVFSGTATFINYDFLETVHVVPVDGSVQTHIKATGDYMLLPVPIAITEGYEPSYETIEVNLEAESSAGFYEWVEGLTKR
jgi:hypothetical protein